jgi:O-antigen ligase
MIDWGSLYRFFAYLNVLIVLLCYQDDLYGNVGSDKIQEFFYFLCIPLFFLGLHFLTAENCGELKEVRRVILATFLALGIWLSVKSDPNYIEKNITYFSVALLLTYVVVQTAAMLILDRPYGVNKNPHILAFYSSLAFIASIYFCLKVNMRLKVLLAFTVFILGIFLLKTSSRPIWIALICSGFSILFFLDIRFRKLASFLIVAVLTGLTLTNVGNFAGRFSELLRKINTEERVTIWQDTWRMQTDSSISEWMLGHGLNSFEHDFKYYSHYHLDKVDFNSPHNFILELIYVSGVVGILVSLIFVFLIYKNLVCNIRRNSEFKDVYILLFALLTENLLATSITVQFFSTYNLNIIALTVAIMFSIMRFYEKK